MSKLTKGQAEKLIKREYKKLRKEGYSPEKIKKSHKVVKKYY